MTAPRIGFDAMMRGEGDVVSGWKNELQSALANIMPAAMLARQCKKTSRAAIGATMTPMGDRRGQWPQLTVGGKLGPARAVPNKYAGSGPTLYGNRV